MYLTNRYFSVVYNNIMKILGLKPVRINEWWAILRLEGRSEGVVALLSMIHKAFRFGVTRAEWRTRMRVCIKCPIYNSNLRQCRPTSHRKMGCGCYTPFLAMTKGECWGKTHTENLGWE